LVKSCGPKDEMLTQCEVRERSNGDADHVSGEEMQVKITGKQSHQKYVGNQGNQAVAQVKSQQAPEHVCRAGIRGPFSPRPSFVPDEIVEHCSFYGQGCGYKIVKAENSLPNRERG
jgi:hypothetical protein